VNHSKKIISSYSLNIVSVFGCHERSVPVSAALRPTLRGCSGGESLVTYGRFNLLGVCTQYLRNQRHTSYHLYRPTVSRIKSNFYQCSKFYLVYSTSVTGDSTALHCISTMYIVQRTFTGFYNLMTYDKIVCNLH